MSVSTETIYNLYVQSRLMDDYSVDERAVNGIDAYKVGYKLDDTILFNPSDDLQIFEQQFLGQNYPEIAITSHTADNFNTPFIPVNGIPFKMMFGYENTGHGSYVSDTTHVIQNMPSTQADIPEYIWFREFLGGEVREFYGCVPIDLSVEQNVDKSFVRFDMSWRPHSQLYGTSVPNSRKFAQTNGDVEITDVFRLLDTFTWNAEAIAKTKSISFQATRNVNELSRDSTNKKVYLDVGKIVTCGMAWATANPPAAMRTDYKAHTPRTVIWKVTKANTDRYFQITINNFVIQQMIEINQVGEPTLYSCMGTGEDVTVIISDTVDNDHYDEPTESLGGF